MRKKPLQGVDYGFHKPLKLSEDTEEMRNQNPEDYKVLSVRVSKDLSQQLEKLELDTGLSKSDLLRTLLDRGAVVQKGILRKQLELKPNADSDTIFFPDKGSMIEDSFMRYLLFADVDLDKGIMRSMRRKYWD